MKTYAIVASLFPPHVGGVERYSYNLAKKLTEHGNRVIVITSGAGEVKEEGGIKVYYLPIYKLFYISKISSTFAATASQVNFSFNRT